MHNKTKLSLDIAWLPRFAIEDSLRTVVYRNFGQLSLSALQLQVHHQRPLTRSRILPIPRSALPRLMQVRAPHAQKQIFANSKFFLPQSPYTEVLERSFNPGADAHEGRCGFLNGIVQLVHTHTAQLYTVLESICMHTVVCINIYRHGYIWIWGYTGIC